MKTRHLISAVFAACIFVINGCSWFNGLTSRSQSPDTASAFEEKRPHLVGDLAVPTGMYPVRIEAIGLVTGLRGTGSDPSPSPQRAALLEEMQMRGVDNPNGILASGNVSLVLIQGWLRPGIQKGDHFDVEVRVPSQSETTSLRGGYLLESRLTETAVLSNQVHRGKLLAMVRGPVMVDPSADPKKDRILMCRGRVLGSGTVLESRPMGLVLTPEHQNVMNSSRVANAINKRFNIFQSGIKSGVAKAKTAELIELTVHPRYKDNITRYVQVIRALPLSESAPDRMSRLRGLESQLLDPESSADAAMQLEAIGSDGVETLLKGIKSSDAEVKFYSAEALAYLDRREAAEPLGQIARDQPAFRVFALTALSAMQEFSAYEQLRDLLPMPSAETRYGAFRALWAMNAKDPLVKGESLGGQFNYHVLDVGGPPMVHVCRSRLSEVVVFGPDQRLLTPLAVNAGNQIMVTSSGGNEISISKYSVRDGDEKRIVSTKIDDVIRAIVELGGTYPDVVQALQEAKTAGALASRFEIDSLPEAGREYDRVAEVKEPENGKKADDDDEQPQPKTIASRAAPDLFVAKGGRGAGAVDDGHKESDDDENPEEKKGFFSKLFKR